MATTRTRAPTDGRRARKEEGLDSFTKLLVAAGVCGAVLLATGIGLLMFGLRQSDHSTAYDPDAQTPVIQPDHPRELVDFSLTDQRGQAVTREGLRGKIVLVDFLFTSCSITCPYVNAQLKKVQDAMASDPRVRLLSITLDPDDDTVEVLSKYAARLGAEADRWSFLTGDTLAIRKLIGTSFLAKDTTGTFSYMPGNFANTQRIVLVDATGKVVCYFDGLNQNAGEAALAQIRQLDASP